MDFKKRVIKAATFERLLASHEKDYINSKSVDALDAYIRNQSYRLR